MVNIELTDLLEDVDNPRYEYLSWNSKEENKKLLVYVTKDNKNLLTLGNYLERARQYVTISLGYIQLLSMHMKNVKDEEKETRVKEMMTKVHKCKNKFKRLNDYIIKNYIENNIIFDPRTSCMFNEAKLAFLNEEIMNITAESYNNSELYSLIKKDTELRNNPNFIKLSTNFPY